jgi:heme-degrading monooxygenase HmoA
MFSVLIEVRPSEGQWNAYLANAKRLRPELEEAPGFLGNARYRSLTRPEWILSLSGWRDEGSVAAWHERMRDEEGGEKGWDGLLSDYRLRVGEVTSDTRPPDGVEIRERRHGEAAGGARDGAGDGGGAAAGEGISTYVTLIDARQTPEWVKSNNPYEIALYLGFDLYSYGACLSWDILDSLDSPGEIILMVTWKDAQSASDHAATEIVPDDARVRVVRVVLDYALSGGGFGAPAGGAPRAAMSA